MTDTDFTTEAIALKITAIEKQKADFVARIQADVNVQVAFFNGQIELLKSLLPAEPETKLSSEKT